MKYFTISYGMKCSLDTRKFTMLTCLIEMSILKIITQCDTRLRMGNFHLLTRNTSPPQKKTIKTKQQQQKTTKLTKQNKQKKDTKKIKKNNNETNNKQKYGSQLLLSMTQNLINLCFELFKLSNICIQVTEYLKAHAMTCSYRLSDSASEVYLIRKLVRQCDNFITT